MHCNLFGRNETRNETSMDHNSIDFMVNRMTKNIKTQPSETQKNTEKLRCIGRQLCYYNNLTSIQYLMILTTTILCKWSHFCWSKK